MHFEDQGEHAATLLQFKVIFSKSFLTETKKERLYQERKLDYIKERKILCSRVFLWLIFHLAFLYFRKRIIGCQNQPRQDIDRKETHIVIFKNCYYGTLFIKGLVVVWFLNFRQLPVGSSLCSISSSLQTLVNKFAVKSRKSLCRVDINPSF